MLAQATPANRTKSMNCDGSGRLDSFRENKLRLVAA
jgi:hypothetical protein